MGIRKMVVLVADHSTALEQGKARGAGGVAGAQRRRKSSLGMPAMSEEELEAGRRLPQQDPAGWHGGGEGSRFDSEGRLRSFEDSMQPAGRKGRDSSRSSSSSRQFSSANVPSGRGGQQSQVLQSDSASDSDEVPFETEEERWAFQTASDADSDSSDGEEVGVVLTRHGRPSKTASKKSGSSSQGKQMLLPCSGRLPAVRASVQDEGLHLCADRLHVCATCVCD